VTTSPVERLRRGVEEIKEIIKKRKEAKKRALEEHELEKARLTEAKRGFWEREERFKDEKIRLGREVLRFFEELRREESFRELLRIVAVECSNKMVVFYRRDLESEAEVLEGLPRNRRIYECFALDHEGRLIYFQNFEPRHFAEGLAAHQIRSRPLDYGGFILKKPEDFTRLSYRSVSKFYEAIKSGRAVDALIEEVKKCIR